MEFEMAKGPKKPFAEAPKVMTKKQDEKQDAAMMKKEDKKVMKMVKKKG